MIVIRCNEKKTYITLCNIGAEECAVHPNAASHTKHFLMII